MFLPDVNIWLALGFGRHVHHLAAKSWFDALPDRQCCFCRLTQQGFLRLASNPKAFDDEAAPLNDAWRLYDAFVGDPRITYVEEPAGLEPLWRSYTQGQAFSPKIWNDAYLAAFARAATYELVAFDKGFKVYSGVSCAVLG